MILVDYRCPGCGPIEVYASSPPPLVGACPTCGQSMARRFTTAGLAGSTPAPAGGLGMCFGSASAQRRLHAMAIGDDRAYANETAQQARRFEQNGPPAAAEVSGHAHD